MDKKTIMEKAAKIKLAVFDVDGVLTDGKLILCESGNEYKSFHVRDGHGLVMLMEAGCKVAVITARSSNIVAERMECLGIEYVFQNEKDKGVRLLNLLKNWTLNKNKLLTQAMMLLTYLLWSMLGYLLQLLMHELKLKIMRYG